MVCWISDSLTRAWSRPGGGRCGERCRADRQGRGDRAEAAVNRAIAERAKAEADLKRYEVMIVSPGAAWSGSPSW
jgi:hypothetical protein